MPLTVKCPVRRVIDQRARPTTTGSLPVLARKGRAKLIDLASQGSAQPRSRQVGVEFGEPEKVCARVAGPASRAISGWAQALVVDQHGQCQADHEGQDQGGRPVQKAQPAARRMEAVR